MTNSTTIKTIMTNQTNDRNRIETLYRKIDDYITMGIVIYPSMFGFDCVQRGEEASNEIHNCNGGCYPA